MSASIKVSLEQFFSYCTERNLPFTFYRLPEGKTVKVIAQKKSAVTKISPGSSSSNLKGFLFAPFHENEQFNKVLIQPDIFCDAAKLPMLDFASATIEIAAGSKKPKTHLKESNTIMNCF